MKVLWSVNFPLPILSSINGTNIVVNEGWISGMAFNLRERKNVELSICYPQKNSVNTIKNDANNIHFIGYYIGKVQTYDKGLQQRLMDILFDEKPDIVHIMGTEYPHTLSMVLACKACGLGKRTVISIQGLVSECARYTDKYLPFNVAYGNTMYGIYKQDSVYGIKRSFKKRGKYEIAAIQNAQNIIGRTDWDNACVKKINGDADYYFNNEILRNSFYDAQWNLKMCERYTIFVSQATYALKGFHILLQAMPLVIKKFPEVRIKVAGGNRLQFNRPRYKMTKYDRYLFDLIIKNHLQSNVDFLGQLQEQDMVRQYLQAHVYVSSSFIENSSNSLGEAMLLGVPCISSDVGGIKSLIEHGNEGFLYQSDMPYMLAYYICRIFENDDLALKLSSNAREHALRTHDREHNVECLFNIYKKIGGDIE